jgi:hypothetical protein
MVADLHIVSESMDFGFPLVPAKCSFKCYKHFAQAVGSRRVMSFKIQAQLSVQLRQPWPPPVHMPLMLCSIVMQTMPWPSPKQLCRQYAVFQLRPTPWPTFGSSAAAVASAVCLPVKFSGLSLHIIMVFLHDASWVLEMTSNITETAIEELQVTLEKKWKA